MHTVELLERAIALARQCGFVVRQDFFGGSLAGACEFKGRRWLFIDLAQSPREQLEQVLQALGEGPHLAGDEAPAQLQAFVKLRKAA
jgi:hypothetical protein